MPNLTAFDIIPLNAYSFTVIAKSITGIITPFIREPRLSLEELILCLLYGGLYGATFG